MIELRWINFGSLRPELAAFVTANKGLMLDPVITPTALSMGRGNLSEHGEANREESCRLFACATKQALVYGSDLGAGKLGDPSGQLPGPNGTWSAAVLPNWKSGVFNECTSTIESSTHRQIQDCKHKGSACIDLLPLFRRQAPETPWTVVRSKWRGTPLFQSSSRERLTGGSPSKASYPTVSHLPFPKLNCLLWQQVRMGLCETYVYRHAMNHLPFQRHRLKLLLQVIFPSVATE